MFAAWPGSLPKQTSWEKAAGAFAPPKRSAKTRASCTRADIRQNLCIGCQLCYVAYEDGAHQCIEPYTVAGDVKKNRNGMGVHVPRIMDDECVGCNLCALVCPVDQCITMKQIDSGQAFESWNMRAKRLATDPAPGPAS